MNIKTRIARLESVSQQRPDDTEHGTRSRKNMSGSANRLDHTEPNPSGRRAENMVRRLVCEDLGHLPIQPGK